MSEPVDYLEPQHPHHPWRYAAIGLFGFVLIYGVTVGSLMAYGKEYKDRVMPGVFVGSIGLGGMNKTELTQFFQSMNDRLLTEGVAVTVKKADGNTEHVAFYPIVPAGEDSRLLITMDVEAEVNKLLAYGKKERLLGTGFSAAKLKLQKPHLVLGTVNTDPEKLKTALSERLGQYETVPKDAEIHIVSAQPLKYEITSSSPGVVFSYDVGMSSIVADWRELKLPTVSFSPEFINSKIHEQTILEQVEKLPDILKENILFTYVHPDSKQEFKWTVKPGQFAEWIKVAIDEANSSIRFVFSEEKLQEFLDSKVAPTITVEAQDAKFRVNAEGRVVEFQGSRTGVGIDLAATYDLANEQLFDRFAQGTSSGAVAVVVEETAPTITTGDVNNLGITGVLGVGISSFAGSPTNRVINIRNAVKKLNGIIIKPGEEFSTIEHTKPFTLEGGYLPEKVIKGDEIKAEIGGGLCQIGSTLFRMAMNSAMPITERRNHSLVVPYYNDARNKLPGTDATIYDPAPDFKFLNDTGNNILIQTDMNTKTAELRFTIWGTSDGRKGSYSPPVVKRWIPYGETRIIETTKLEPGKKECQHAYKGADTAFTYYRVLPDGTKEDRVFESHYRPLPEICLVGVEEKPTCETPDAEGKCPVVAPPALDDASAVGEQVPVVIE